MMMTSIGDNDNILRNISPGEVNDFLGEYTWEAKWGNVRTLYYKFPEEAHTAIISESDGTALHVAIDLNEEDVVKDLVHAILTQSQSQSQIVKALEMENQRGDTPLHLAASRGFAKICQWIIGRNKERIYLLSRKNKQGETPLFQAAVNWKKQTFAYLADVSKDSVTLQDLVREDGDSILHTAIRGEYFDLAVIIVNRYDFLSMHLNKEESTPLKVLAARPSAFKSASKLSWYKRILYHCILVEPLDADRTMRSILRKMEVPPDCNKMKIPKMKLPENYKTLYHFVYIFGATIFGGKKFWKKKWHDTEDPPKDNRAPSEKKPHDTEDPPNDNRAPSEKKPHNTEDPPNDNRAPSEKYFVWSIFGATIFGKKFWASNDNRDPSEKYPVGYLPPNYGTFHQFVKSAYVHTLGLSGVELKDVKIAKKKHQWSSQLLKALMMRPYAAFTGTGGRPTDIEVDPGVYDVFSQKKQDGAKSLEDDEQKPDVVGETSLMSSKRKKENDEQKPDVTVEISLTSSENKKENEKKENDEQKPNVIVETSLTSSKRKKENDEQKPDVKVEISLTSSEEKKEKEMENDKKMTPFLVAAQNGIVEVVNEMLSKIPSAIHNTNSKRENVLLVAVKYRQPLIVQTLRDQFEHSKPELWNNLILAIDEDENTVLHLAAEALDGAKPWQIAGSALQMMWDIKWFQYIKSFVPAHFYFKSNKKGTTSGEIFKDTHVKLIKDSSDWLKETSESCSVVAALVAGVSFATASAVPGGTNDEGRPILEGKPAFDVFAISSLIGLCFSVTGLIMFLSILTSRKQAKDFRRDLPLKLLIGLSSLFVSIASMFVSFCTGHFFLLSHNFKSILFPVYAATCLPVTFYAVAQFPLYFDLFTAILAKVPLATDKGDGL